MSVNRNIIQIKIKVTALRRMQSVFTSIRFLKRQNQQFETVYVIKS